MVSEPGLLNLSYLKNGIVIVSVTLPRYFNIWLPLLRWSWSLNNVLLIFSKISLNRRWQFFNPRQHDVTFRTNRAYSGVLQNWEFLIEMRDTNLPPSSLYYPSFWWKKRRQDKPFSFLLQYQRSSHHCYLQNQTASHPSIFIHSKNCFYP